MSLFADNSRDGLRAAWREAWQRHEQGLPLEALQLQLVSVIAAHPEYQALVRNPEMQAEGTEGDTNPFLHLGLHLALREQLATNRPAGITGVHRGLMQRGVEAHTAEHRMMTVLGEALWQAQRAGHAPDERAYIKALRGL